MAGAGSEGAVWRAAQSGTLLELVEALDDAQASLLEAVRWTPCGDPRTALWHAAARGNVDMVTEVCRFFTREEQTDAFLKALEGDYVDVLNALAVAGADVSVQRASDAETALHLAARRGDMCLLEALLPSTCVDVTQCDDLTPLMCASMRGHAAVVARLLDAGACVNACEEDGYTPLHFACVAGHVGVAQQLISARADFTVLDAAGFSPLNHAMFHSHEAIVLVLLRNGAPLTPACKRLWNACRGGAPRSLEQVQREVERAHQQRAAAQRNCARIALFERVSM